MAITRSAKKALRVSDRRKLINDRRVRKMKEMVKNVRQNVETKAIKNIKEELSLAYKALDKAVKTGVIKKGNASRKKSRLAKAIAKLSK